MSVDSHIQIPRFILKQFADLFSSSKKYSKGRRKIQQQVSTLRDWSASATQSHMERRPL